MHTFLLTAAGPKARRAATALALTAALPLAMAASAQADSIAYVKGGDAWLATPDGARQVQVTHTGDVSYVSQADDGTMIALVGGERLRKLARDGRTLAEFATYVSDGAPVPGPVTTFGGPFAPQISPDGSLVAFEWFNDTYTEGAGCDAINGCYLHKGSQGVGVTRSDRLTGAEEFGLLTGWIAPRWLAGDKLLRSYSGATANDDAVFSEVGPGKGGSGLDPWFTDTSGRGPVRDVELSRPGGVAVAVGGEREEQLRVYRPIVEPYGAPDVDHRPFADNTPVVEQCFERTDPAGGTIENPSLAPAGRAVAYGTRAGIRIAGLPDLHAGCAAGAVGDALILPGGRFPDWGPADVPASVSVPTGPQGVPSAGGVAGSPGGQRSIRRLTVLPARLARALSKGLVVRVSGVPAGTQVRARSGTRVVASGPVRAGRAVLRFSRSARRSLTRKRRVRLIVVVSDARKLVTLRR